MKNHVRTTLTAACLSLVCTMLCAQSRDPFDEIRKDPDKAGTVMYMYNHDIPPFAKPPKGYKPFYISHYGRHGARNHDSNNDFDIIRDVFEAAREKGVLTERGKKCYDDYAAMYGFLAGRGGDITGRGVEQHHRIAHNMYTNYRNVLKGSARVDAVSTTVPRVILSMCAFCDQLQSDNPKMQIEKQASKCTMSYLNPFTTYNPDVDKVEEGFHNKKVCWNDGFYDYMRAKLKPEQFFSNLFTDLDFLKEFGDPANLEFIFSSTLVGNQDNENIKSDLCLYFDIDELCRAFEVANYRFYVSKGPDTLLQHGRQYSFAWRTLDDIVRKADEDLTTGNYAARLRFGHDIIVMGILKILEVEGYNHSVASFDDILKYWCSYDFPMALNLQFIFYRNNSSDILVRVMYNERDLELPLENCGTRFYYRWNDLKSYICERIEVSKDIISRYPCVK